MHTKEHGFIALLSVLLLSVVLLGAVISLAQYGVISRYALLTLEQKKVSEARARGCLEVARIAIVNDPLYETVDKQVSESGSWCVIALIDAQGSESLVRVSASSSGATTNFEAVVDRTLGAVVEINEVISF